MRIRVARRWFASPWLLVTATLVLALTAAPGRGQGIQIAPGQQGRLRADRVRYDARAQVLIAEGHVQLTLGALDLRADRLRLEQKTLIASAEGNVRVRQPDFSLDAVRVRYDIRRRRTAAEGGVAFIQADLTLRAGAMTFDEQPQTVVASGGVTVTQGSSTLTGQMVRADLRGKRAEAQGEAQLVRTVPATPVPGIPPGEPSNAGTMDRPPQAETVIRAARLQLRWDVNEAQAQGEVTVRQGKMTARAREARYAEAAGRLELDGDVVVDQFGEQAAAGARLTCERLAVLLRERDMEASGKVTVSQKGRVASGDRGTYTDRTKRVVLIGRVQLQDEEGNIIRADSVTMDLESETFEASGNVETIFTVRRGK